ncbi:hypothetical protein SODG_006747 [Sodalis praecaptivus]
MNGIGSLSPSEQSRYAGNPSQAVNHIESIYDRAANAVNQQDNIDPLAAYMAQKMTRILKTAFSA